MEGKSRIYVAVPALNELEYLPSFIACIQSQTYQNFELLICINQPDDWWGMTDKLSICENNAMSISWLKTLGFPSLRIIDRSSKGLGWKGKKHGVGWARKTIMDRIAESAKDDDIIICLDADTTFNSCYFKAVIKTFEANKKAVALSNPYYHKLTGDENADRQILRYEIYMRYFALNLWRIGSPYAFTAIGSAISLPVKAYKAIGGITPHLSGEDFYFLQKLRKYGKVLSWNAEKVYPAARFSDRVFFGTGPAMIKGSEGNWNTYPIFSYPYFDEVKATYDQFKGLFEKDNPTPMDKFIEEKFGGQPIWKPLRKNAKKMDQFVKACHHKIDAFRIFQYLKWRNDQENNQDEKELNRFIEKFYPDQFEWFGMKDFSFEFASIKELDAIRNSLVKIEEEIQVNHITS
jgi:glycosyltransferase involved in cell wall biosynthesis